MIGGLAMKHVIGLDIGIASVGWSVINLERNRIEDLGVRVFPAPEHPRDGSSLAKKRREAGGARKRIQRKRTRLLGIRQLFQEYGILSLLEMDALFQRPLDKNPYEIRVDGLSRHLSSTEWFQALYHIAKHRGFQSTKKTPPNSKEKEKEEGALLEGIKSNASLLQEAQYRTVGEMIFMDSKFQDHKRNKHGDYSHTIPQSLLREEIETLFFEQQRLGNPYTTDEFKRKILDTFASRLHFAAPGQIESRVGPCTFEAGEKRAPCMSWSAERFILFGKINNLRIRDYFRGERSLSIGEARDLANLAYQKAEVKYKDIRKLFDLDDTAFFSGIRYSGKDTEREKSEGAVFVRLKGTHELRRAIASKLGKEEWETYASTPEILDEIARTLTWLKNEEDIRKSLSDKNIPSYLIEAVLDLDFKGTINLSFKALKKILPHMENGLRFDEAKKEAGYRGTVSEIGSVRSVLLPPEDFDDITNPVVKRSLHQTRKVVNALVRKFGSPWSIHIELAREMGKSFDDRDKIQKKQNENNAEKERMRKEFIENYTRDPSGTDLLKFRLWKEQGGFDPYHQVHIDSVRLFHQGDATYAEIDHIIPYSRSFDNSYTNKVLVLAEANRNKGNRTPREYIFSESRPEKWEAFVAWVEAQVRNGKKKSNLLRESFTLDDSNRMTERNLTDTRFITSYLANYLERCLVFSDPSPTSRKVLRVNGAVTATLRGKWGLNKDREAGHLHHALDAAVVAVTSHGLIQSITKFDQERNTLGAKFNTGGVRERTPQPWEGFRHELNARLRPNPSEEIGKVSLPSYGAEESASLRPVFVSHMPVRKAKGAAHKESVRSAKLEENGGTCIRTPLEGLNFESLEKMVGKERDKRLYESLKERLAAYGGDGGKAFGGSAPPFYKPTKDGSQGPLVRTIKVFRPGTSGVRVRGGIAENDNMVRVDVYRYKNKYSLAPHYVPDIAKGIVKKRGVLAHKEEKDWEVIGDEHKFCFSLFPNDLLEITSKNGEKTLGYYRGMNRNDGRIDLTLHDGSNQEDICLSTRTCQSIRKFQVGILGDYHEVKKEKPPQGKIDDGLA
jgi:CRISPR-associated endonuclease Csn1